MAGVVAATKENETATQGRGGGKAEAGGPGAASGSGGDFGCVIFFDPADGKMQGIRRIGTDTFFKGNFAPDGQTIALGGVEVTGSGNGARRINKRDQ